MIGRSAPDFDFGDGTRLGELLHEGRGVLLDFVGGDAVCDLCNGWKDRVKYSHLTVKDALGLSAVLIRPDGFVVWAAEGEPDAEGARATMTRWFGSPVC